MAFFGEEGSPPQKETRWVLLAFWVEQVKLQPGAEAALPDAEETCQGQVVSTVRGNRGEKEQRRKVIELVWSPSYLSPR